MSPRPHDHGPMHDRGARHDHERRRDHEHDRAPRGPRFGRPSGPRHPSLLRAIAPFLVLLVLALGYGCWLQFSMKEQTVRAEEEWSALATLLDERAEIVPRFVDKVRELSAADPAAGEADRAIVEPLLDKLAATGAALANAQSPAIAANDDAQLGATLGDLLYAVREMTTLRADDEYQELLTELADSETAITDARARYNAIVLKENQLVSKGIGRYVAPLFRLDAHEYFNAEVPKAEPLDVQRAPLAP